MVPRIIVRWCWKLRNLCDSQTYLFSWMEHRFSSNLKLLRFGYFLHERLSDGCQKSKPMLIHFVTFCEIRLRGEKRLL